ncbi:putative transposable element encoded protein [Trachipleistophora hominis]|uniref:Putative transposable element encoded protein n=1 Tax=Trachipleistophora hominis TaxID=72359 RepID=L7JUT2_TRAHO|nr:putative transposable element encoded protein [Trachipleistophora hominis]
MRDCQELNTCENPREEESLRILLRGPHASHDLRVKVTVAVVAYLSFVVVMRAKLFREMAH